MSKVFLAKSTGTSLDVGSEFNQARFREFLKENKDKWIRIELPQPKRSNQQNRYFWMVLELIERETGNSTTDMHEYVKRHLTPKVEKTIRLLQKDGTWKEHTGMAGKGTSELSKIEFGEMMDKLSALTGVALPDPNMLDNFIPN